MTPNPITELKQAAEKATPGLEWIADMDRYILIGKPPGSSFINAEVSLALCATGDHAARLVSYLAEAQPTVILSLLADLERKTEALKQIGAFQKSRPTGEQGSYQRGYDIGFNNAGLYASGIARAALQETDNAG